MSQGVKILLGIAGLALVIAGAAFAYNLLGKDVSPPGTIGLAESQGRISSGASDKQMALDFTMLDRDGNEIKLSDLIGKPLVLNFWASWCPPCRNEMPEFDKVAAELGSEVQFVMLNLTDGQRETIQSATAYMDDRDFSLPLYFDTMQEGVYQYNIQSIPTTIFIDKNGYIANITQGGMNQATLRKGIELCSK